MLMIKQQHEMIELGMKDERRQQEREKEALRIAVSEARVRHQQQSTSVRPEGTGMASTPIPNGWMRKTHTAQATKTDPSIIS